MRDTAQSNWLHLSRTGEEEKGRGGGQDRLNDRAPTAGQIPFLHNALSRTPESYLQLTARNNNGAAFWWWISLLYKGEGWCVRGGGVCVLLDIWQWHRVGIWIDLLSAVAACTTCLGATSSLCRTYGHVATTTCHLICAGMWQDLAQWLAAYQPPKRSHISSLFSTYLSNLPLPFVVQTSAQWAKYA